MENKTVPGQKKLYDTASEWKNQSPTNGILSASNTRTVPKFDNASLHMTMLHYTSTRLVALIQTPQNSHPLDNRSNPAVLFPLPATSR
eukprot:c15737_g1_i1 orf=171-434(-)